jgi:hypothetical protein
MAEYLVRNRRNGPAGECCRRLCCHRLPDEDVELGVLDLSEAGLVKSLKGIRRTIGVDGAPHSVWVSDGQSGARMTEQQYRVGAYLPP